MAAPPRDGDCSLIRVDASIGLAARERRQFGAFIAWTLARRSPTGMADLQFPSPKSTKSRWLKQAYQAGLIFRQEDSEPRYASVIKAGLLLRPRSFGRPVDVPVDLFLADPLGWTWAAFLTSVTRKGIPFSRAKLEQLSGVPERTQREWERRLPIEKVQHYAKGANVPGLAKHYRDTGDHPGAFTDYSGRTCWPLPNSYIVKTISRGPRRRRAAKVLTSALALSGAGERVFGLTYVHVGGKWWWDAAVPNLADIKSGSEWRWGPGLPACIGLGRRWVPRAEVGP